MNRATDALYYDNLYEVIGERIKQSIAYVVAIIHWVRKPLFFQSPTILDSSHPLWHYCAMHTKQTIQSDLKKMGIDPKGTVLAHFSYTSLGE
ncbi:MAG TPA: hypothetical protein VJ869_17720, partial [Sphaerochaeta sp.]|nr:hypothetical protein [Sphaerochaeta sp.]